MCRLLSFTASPEGLEALQALAELFIEASRSDPFLREVTGGAEESHGDGWGFAVASSKGIATYKTARQVWLSNEVERLKEALRGVEGANRLYGLVHSCKAGRTEPIGAQHSHPYGYGVKGGELSSRTTEA